MLPHGNARIFCWPEADELVKISNYDDIKLKLTTHLSQPERIALVGSAVALVFWSSNPNPKTSFYWISTRTWGSIGFLWVSILHWLPNISFVTHIWVPSLGRFFRVFLQLRRGQDKFYLHILKALLLWLMKTTTTVFDCLKFERFLLWIII